MNTENPLLLDTPLPAFAAIRPQHAEAALDARLQAIRAAMAQLLDNAEPTWRDTLQPLEDLDDALARSFSPVSHLHNVADSEALRAAYNQCLPKLTDYHTEKYQDERLFRATQKIAARADFAALPAAERKIVNNMLRDFRLAGVDLPPEPRARFKTLKQELAKLQTRFEENLLDATQAWKKVISTAEELRGVPESVLGMLCHNAEREQQNGYLLTLDLPCYRPLLAYCANRALREEIYTAYVTRASGQGPLAGQHDNTAIMDEIISKRLQLARLLGYQDFAEYSLATKMAESPAQVESFLRDLAARAHPFALQEKTAVEQFARERDGLTEVQAWDVPYYSERLREEKFAINQEELRPYFPVPAVINGLFALVEKLYGLRIVAAAAAVWHSDVRYYEIHDAAASGSTPPRGCFYLDLYARAQKRGGAWMDECNTRRVRADGSVQVPVAYLNCNFTPPVAAQPSLLTHDEVITLFHEFGHGLHHMLTRVARPSVAGINGVAWDAVELPSQFMENWCWQREAVTGISAQVQTGTPLPAELFDKLKRARHFQSALMLLRQIEFALFDFRLHREYDPLAGQTVDNILQSVRAEVAVLRPPAFNRFPNSFSHIFAGGYAAGYYSYKWAEVLSADAFARFREEGLYNPEIGRAFLREILEVGGTRDAAESFRAFRGRAPTIDALLADSGLAA